MQVNATIIAAQQAAREARAALLQPKPAQPAASFLTELDKQEPAAAAPKAAAAPASSAVQTAAPQANTRPGSLVNIVI